MPVDDKFLAMRCRRMLAKKTCDMSMMTISARRGVVHLGGELRQARGFGQKQNLKDELASIIEIIKKMGQVRDVTCDVRVIG